MKHLTALAAALALALASFAQPIPPADGPAGTSFPPLSPRKAETHGIITEQPAGELRQYTRSGGATWASLYFMTGTQTDILAEVVFSDDGHKAYFKNIISHAATGTWVEGTVEGNTITVPLGQMVFWWDSDENGDTYGMKLARLHVNGSINEGYTVDTAGSITFAVEGDNLRLEGTSGDPSTNVFDGIGLVYTDKFENEWSYYLDYATVYTRVEEAPVVPPADLQTETYSLSHEGYGHLVQVGFHGNDVYVQGVSEDNVPAAWMKGTMHGNKITFPVQYAGSITSNLLYFCGADARNEGGQWLYYWTDGSITFDYDPETRSFASQQTLFVNNSKTGVSRGEVFGYPVFAPYAGDRPATPADPHITYYINYSTDTRILYIATMKVPVLDVDGNFINPAHLAYQLYVDDDEPYTLYTDEYRYLTEDVDVVPYLFADDEQRTAFNRSYIYEKAYAIYIYQTGFDRIGIQSIYRVGDDERRSSIVYYDIVPTRVAGGTAGTQPAARYDLQGRPAGKGHKGLTLTRTTDGRVLKSLLR